MTKSIAIIPARGGSKRIPKKNIKHFLGKPIIEYAIEAAIASKLFDVVMVSTDDMEIAKIALKAGAEVPFLRTPENSSDFATTSDVIEEVLNKYLSLNIVFEYACCIYPTAPFVTLDLLKEGKDLLQKHHYDSVFPVVQYSYPIQRSLLLDENEKVSMVWNEFLNSRSQDLKKRYHDTGLFYWLESSVFLKSRKLFTENSGSIILREVECQDIDTVEDWMIAEIKYKILKDEKIGNKLSKIILGTAQIGMHYGINNTSELLSLEDSLEILNFAKLNGISELDTANAYGESERVIGLYNRCANLFTVNTKISKANFNNLDEHVLFLLNKMSLNTIDTLYIHKINDLFENKNILKKLSKIKNEWGVCKKIGLSVYSNEEIKIASEIKEIDVVQCPFNLLDNDKLRASNLNLLKEKGKEVHVRSIFLQGLFFADLDKLPSQVIELKPYLNKIKNLCEKYNCSISSLALQYVLSKPYIDKIIFGVDNISQLKLNLNEISENLNEEIFQCIDEIDVKETILLNPGNWHL
jgi:pseudaminic acid cytidylyltransferase